MKARYDLSRKKLLIAIEEDELRLFLGGKGLYSLGYNVYSPGKSIFNPELAMVEIYNYYKDEPNCGIALLLEKNLLRWLEYKSGVGVYKTFITISYQMEMERKKIAPFKLNYEVLLPALKNSIAIYKEKLAHTIDFEGEVLERSLWEEMQIENHINLRDYGINLLD